MILLSKNLNTLLFTISKLHLSLLYRIFSILRVLFLKIRGHSLNFLRRSYIPKDTYKVFPFPKLAETIQIL